MALRHWLQLSLTEGIGPILTQRLIEACGSVDAACEITGTQLRNIEGIGASKATKIYASLRAAATKVDAEIERAQRIGIELIGRDDDAYPVMLREIPDPPNVLYVKGALEARDLNSVAIVGSRKCSFYGREQAERFGALLAGAGFTVASGGARGIDSSAHRGAMSHSLGRTIAVLGCGVDQVYPPENGALFEQIAKQGAVMSEYPIGTPPLAENFPRRNRIVSGISRGVLVIEADIRSGALITARQACDDHGRPVFALPGRVDQQLSAGPHQLIRDGAILTTNLEDITAALGPLPQAAFDIPTTDAEPAPPPVSSAVLSHNQKTILNSLDGDAVGIDTLVDRTNLPAAAVMSELTLLTLKGLVRRVDGQNFAKVQRR